jgi:hypothetical protein
MAAVTAAAGTNGRTHAPVERVRLAVVGDVHGQWSAADAAALTALAPDAVLFVGESMWWRGTQRPLHRTRVAPFR